TERIWVCAVARIGATRQMQFGLCIARVGGAHRSRLVVTQYGLIFVSICDHGGKISGIQRLWLAPFLFSAMHRG
ncbi:MAG: hypothetical protein WKF77_24220, partial [Planctomycetaceae bacterium]